VPPRLERPEIATGSGTDKLWASSRSSPNRPAQPLVGFVGLVDEAVPSRFWRLWRRCVVEDCAGKCPMTAKFDGRRRRRSIIKTPWLRGIEYERIVWRESSLSCRTLIAFQAPRANNNIAAPDSERYRVRRGASPIIVLKSRPGRGSCYFARSMRVLNSSYPRSCSPIALFASCSCFHDRLLAIRGGPGQLSGHVNIR